MTASSPWIDGMIETRKSMVRPFTRSRKRPSWGTRFSAMSSSDMTLMPAEDRVVVALVEGLERRVEHAVDPVLGQHLAVLRLDVDVGGAPVDGAQDQRVHEPHDRALAGQRRVVDRRSVSSSRHELEAQRLARLLEQQLAAAVALQQRPRRAPARSHHGVDRPPEQELELVDPRLVVEPAEGEHEARRPRAARARSRSAPAARAGPRPQRAGRRGGSRAARVGRSSVRFTSAMR